MAKKNGCTHLPYADEEVDPIEAADSMPMSFQTDLPDNCLFCSRDQSDEECADCVSAKQEGEHTQDRVRWYRGKNSPRSPRNEQILDFRAAKCYTGAAAPTYRGNMVQYISELTGLNVAV